MGQPQSLQGRLLLLLLAVVATVWVAAAAFTWLDVRHEIDEMFDSHLAQAAALLVAQQLHPEDEDGPARADVLASSRYARKVAFQVFHEGRLALRSATAPAQPMSGQVGRQFRTGFETVRIDSADWRVFAAFGQERDVQVYVGERVDAREAIVWASLRGMLWPMLVALPLLALAAWWAVHRGVAPLRRLGRVLSARQPQALHPVVVEGAPSEMLPMVDALNGLLGRIGSLLEAERRFTADAAHELRTPIAAIRTQAQVALAHDSDDGRRHALQATLAGCDRASHLVEQLLTLARMDGLEQPMHDSLDLGALVRDAVADQVPRALDRRQDLGLDAAPGCLVRGDAVLLAVLVRNLVDNASRYSPQGARIEVEIRRDGDAVELRVADSGPGLPEPDLARYGERFFRAPGQLQPGSGLGGSIVRRIAAVHGATLDVGRSATLGGLEVRVRFSALS